MGAAGWAARRLAAEVGRRAVRGEFGRWAASAWPRMQGASAGSAGAPWAAGAWPRPMRSELQERLGEASRAAAADATSWARGVLTKRRDPVRRHERRKRWTRRSLLARGVATACLAWVTVHVSSGPGIELDEVFWGSATVVVGAGTVGTGRRLWKLEHTSPPATPARPAPLPPAGSAARPGLVRLTERERVLADLLVHLGPAADDPRVVAADASAALRTHAARVVAVEAARRGAPAESQPGLDAAVAVLTHQLDDGVAGYDALVLAAADAVSASATLRAGDALLAQRLTDATDALAGLARGLREVSE